MHITCEFVIMTVLNKTFCLEYLVKDIYYSVSFGV